MTLLMSVIFMFLMLGAAAALIALFYPESVGALRAANRGLLGLDAGAALLAAAGFAILLNQHDAMLMDHHHAQALFAIGSPDLIVSRAPALAAVAGAARSVLMNAATLALIAIVIKKLPKRWMLALLALAALTVNLSGRYPHAGRIRAPVCHGRHLGRVCRAVLPVVSRARTTWPMRWCCGPWRCGRR